VRDRTWAGVAAATTGAALSPAVASGFVYDDHGFYSGNEALARPSILWRAFTDPSCQRDSAVDAGLWRPLRTLSYALDRAAFGGGAAGPHAVSVLLHAASTGLLFLLLRRFSIGAPAAFFGAILFGLHPAQTECVAWLSSRGDVLAMALVLAAILCDLSGRTRSAVIAGAAALLAKEQAVVWPALAFVASLLAGRQAREAARRTIGPVAVVLAFLVARKFVGIENAQEGGLGLGRAGAPQIAAMLGHQVWYSLVPVGALFDWQMPWNVHPAPVVLAAAATVPALAWRPTRLATLWFLAALAPTLFVQTVMPLNISVCDRWLLFALPALAIVAAKAVESAGPAPAIVAALCFGTLTEVSIPTWRSDAALWSATARAEPSHWRANAWLGQEALSAGRFDEALERFRTAARSGDDAVTWCMYAESLERASYQEKDAAKTAEARSAYAKAIVLFESPRAAGREALLPTALLGAAETTLVLGDKDGAATELRRLVERPRPEMPDRFAPAFEARVARVAAAVETHLGDPKLAADLRRWGGVR